MTLFRTGDAKPIHFMGIAGAGMSALALIARHRGVSITGCDSDTSGGGADDLTALDDFLKQEGKLEEFEAIAIKEVLAWQIAEAMKAQKLSRKRLAERMGTSRSQIGRLLDPKDGNVTLATLQRAARIVGRTLRLELV